MRPGVEKDTPASADLKNCCAITYGHPLVQWLLGDSCHPGGLELTARVARLMGIEPSSSVLDAGSGRGASAVHLAQTVGCRVTGVTLEKEGVSAGYDLARQHGVEDSVVFVQGDLERVELPGESFDFVRMECVLSILGAKDVALSRLFHLLKPGGRLGLTDVTLSGELPSELQGVLAAVGCVGGALSLGEYRALIEEQGFVVEHTEDCEVAASSFLRDTSEKLLMVEVASKLGKLPVSSSLLAEGMRLLASVQEQVRQGALGYGLVVASKPAPEVD